MYQPRSMLVTGGAGFIGAHFIRHVLMQESNMTLVNLDKLTYAGSLERLNDLPQRERYHFVHGSIEDQQTVSHVLSHYAIDTIVHFAAESHVDRSILAPVDFIQANITGTFVLLEAARQYWLQTKQYDHTHCRFHHISTDEVFGSLARNAMPFTERSSYDPRSPYAASKASADHLVNAYYHTYQLPITLSHCSNNYGLYQHDEKFIPTIIRACLKKEPIPIYGHGHYIRDWIHVEDHCRGVMTIVKQGIVGERYNIGSHNEWENLSLAQLICELFDQLNPDVQPYASRIQFVMDRPGHDLRYAIDASKIKNTLHWMPQISFKEGLQAVIVHRLK